MHCLNDSTPKLIHQLQKAPFPDRSKVWHKMDRLKKPLRDFLIYNGIEIDLFTRGVRRTKNSAWSRVLEQFSAYPHHDQPRDLQEKMARVARQAQKLYDEIADFQHYLDAEAGSPDKGGPNPRKAATRLLVQDLILVSASIFTKPLTVRNDRELKGRDFHGPAITYLRACLDLVQYRLVDAGFSHIASDPALKISVYTLSDWFYEFRQ